MEFLRDSAWQFWGLVVGVVTAFSIYLLQRKNKRLNYVVITETPLLSVDDEIKGKIKIKYGRKNIQNIYLVSFGSLMIMVALQIPHQAGYKCLQASPAGGGCCVAVWREE